MIAAKRRLLAVATIAAALCFSRAALADAMKCSDEQKACLTICNGIANGAKKTACITDCSQRRAACLTTGCWNNGVKMYCDLLRR